MRRYMEEFLTSLDSNLELDFQKECLEQIKFIKRHIKSNGFDLLERDTKIKFLKNFYRTNYDLCHEKAVRKIYLEDEVKV